MPARRKIKIWKTMVFISALLLIALPFIVNGYYSKTEPFFANPVLDPLGFRIRNDEFGEGHFGASRADGKRTHTGLDIEGAIRTKIIAPMSGRVIFASTRGGYGNLLILTHPGGLTSRFAHLDEFRVRKGDWVSRGTEIGLIGKTGNARWKDILPHVHFEIREGDEPVDPIRYLDDVH